MDGKRNIYMEAEWDMCIYIVEWREAEMDRATVDARSD